MSVLLQPNGVKKQNKDKAGVPDPKKLERTGDNTFVVHADGGNYFEGQITDPNIKFKPSGKVTFTNVGVCLKKCLNRDVKCDMCHRFSELIDAS